MLSLGLNRLKRIVIVTLALLLAVATPVAAAVVYESTMYITEDGTASYDMLPLIVPMDTDLLVSEGFITTTGLDTRVLSSGVAIPHLLVDDQVVFASPIVSGTENAFIFQTAQSALASFYITIGYDGYITTADDAALELGDDFAVEIDGYIDTDSGADKIIVEKEDALKVYVSGTEEITARLTTDGPYSPDAAIIDSGYLYVSFDDDPCYITKIDLTTFEVVDILPLSSGTSYVRGFVIESGFLYGACSVDPARIVKVNLSTFTETGYLQLPTGENEPNDIVSDGTYLYIAGQGDDSIVRVSLSTFTRVDALTDAALSDPVELVIEGTDLYAGEQTGGTNELHKIDLTTFTYTSNISLTTTTTIEDLAVDATYIYVAQGRSPARIFRVALATFTETDYLDLAADENRAVSLSINSGYLYVGLNAPESGTPRDAIAKINLTTWLRDSVMTHDSAGSYFALANDGTYLYAPNYGNAPYTLKVTMSTLTLADVVNASVVWLDLVATGIAAGEHKIEILADGVDFSMEIDDVEEDTIAIDDDMADNDNDWVWMSGNAMPYAEYINLDVSSVEIIEYLPAAIISGTTLPDETGTAQDGTITWGSNPSGISVSLGGLIGQGVFVVETGGTYAPLGPFNPGDLITTTPESRSAPGTPFDPIIEFIADTTTWGNEMTWGFVALAMMLGAFALVFAKFQSLMWGGVTASVVVGGFVGIGILDEWFLILIPLMIIGGMAVDQRQTI